MRGIQRHAGKYSLSFDLNDLKLVSKTKSYKNMIGDLLNSLN